MDHDLGVALAGGAIGAALVAVGFLLLRLGMTPAEVIRHDRQARALDQDLEHWVLDEHRALRQELADLNTRLMGEGQARSGVHLRLRSGAKTRRLRRYRDRLAEIERSFADIQAQEGWRHVAWRFLSPRRGWLALHGAETVAPLIADLRAPAFVVGLGWRAVEDPTSWGITEAVRLVTDDPTDRRQSAPGERVVVARAA